LDSENFAVVDCIINLAALVLYLLVFGNHIVHLSFCFWALYGILDLLVIFIELIDEAINHANDVLLAGMETQRSVFASLIWLSCSLGLVTVDITVTFVEAVVDPVLDLVVLLEVSAFKFVRHLLGSVSHEAQLRVEGIHFFLEVLIITLHL